MAHYHKWFWVTQTIFRPSVQALIVLYFHSFDSFYITSFSVSFSVNHCFSFVSAILFIHLSPVHPSSFPLTRSFLFTSITGFLFRHLIPLPYFGYSVALRNLNSWFFDYPDPSLTHLVEYH